MAPLEKEEIFEALSRLGINHPFERVGCFNEYLDYFQRITTP